MRYASMRKLRCKYPVELMSKHNWCLADTKGLGDLLHIHLKSQLLQHKNHRVYNEDHFGEDPYLLPKVFEL
jgi:hypothetical protein